MPLPSRLRTSPLACLLVLLTMTLFSCALDSYERRADVIKDHVESFYSHLKANRVEAAVRENQQIEAIADEIGESVKKRAQSQGLSQVQREFALMKTARETAAQNWIALGQYFAIKQQPDKARTSYQRVVDTYTNPTERLYREQAARAIEDLKILSPAPGRTAQ